MYVKKDVPDSTVSILGFQYTAENLVPWRGLLNGFPQ